MILKKLPKYLMITTCSLGATFLTTSTAFADADISVQALGTATEATTNVDLTVIIPRVLIFGLGATGTAIADAEWNVSAASAGTGNNQTTTAAGTFTAPDPLSATTSASVTGGGTGSATGNTVSLPVFLFSNSGDVLISTAFTGGSGGGGTANVLLPTTGGLGTIPSSDFALSQTGTSILQPAVSGTVSASAGLVNASDTWTYAYTPTNTPVAGTYEARITYVASQP